MLARFASAVLLIPLGAAAAELPAFPTFKAQEIDHSLKIGYAVKVVDLNGDGKPDIVVVDKHRVIWFENPGKRDEPWKLHTILEGTTKSDDVCLDIMDIDGDGKLDIALGAGWTTPTGTIQWLKQGANIDDPWKVYPIGEEPSVHRMRFVAMHKGERPSLVVAPLQGNGATAKNNWSEKGPRMLCYKIPADPTGSWTPDVLTDQLHVVHNFLATGFAEDGGVNIVFASYEGLHLWHNGQLTQIRVGNQENPTRSRGCSEVKLGHMKDGTPFYATIEPWHGNQVVVYTQPADKAQKLWDRHVIDTELKWGHGVWCCDLDGDGSDEIVIGVRDPLTERVRSGVNVFRATKSDATEWEKHVIDNGGVATEDLTCADLDGDGRIDIIAVGRATGNVKVYWNTPGGK